MIYAPHSTLREAAQTDRAILRAKARARGELSRYRAAGVRPSDGKPYPEGEWPGKPVGSGRHCDPIIGIATAHARVRRGKDGLFYVPVDARLPATVERVDGEHVALIADSPDKHILPGPLWAGF